MIKNNKKTKRRRQFIKTLRRYHSKRKGKNGEIRETNVVITTSCLFTAVLLIFSTYAWLSASLNVQINSLI